MKVSLAAYLSRSIIFLCTIFPFLFSSSAIACDMSLPEKGSRDDVLIIVNDNSIDSCAVGAYYAEKRDIGRNNIVHIKTPASYYLTWTEFKIMRDQIIRHMRINTFRDPSIIPASCPAGSESTLYCQESMDQIRIQTKIKYLVTTRGVPTRVVVDDSTLSSSSGPTSVDNYLRHWLINYYSHDTEFDSSIRAASFGDGRGMRIVEPAVDAELIIGRIDGLNQASATALVDRAIAAETNGIYGKHYGSKFGKYGSQAVWRNYGNSETEYVYGDGNIGWQYQHGIFGALNNLSNPTMNAIRFDENINCLTHINNPENLDEGKSPQECVVKLTEDSDAAPGRSSARQPLVDNALVYLGSLDGQPTNGSFDGFMNWRRNDSCSIALCDEYNDPIERDICKQNSTDVFKEINTQCIGVANGFIGYNFQSFPVSFMAVWPTSWYQTTSFSEAAWTHKGGGDINDMAFPDIVEGESADGDGYSVWFRNVDEVDIGDRNCFNDLSLSSTDTCSSDRRIIAFVNRTTFASKTNDISQPDKYRISLKYKATNINAPIQLTVNFFVKETNSNFFQVNYNSDSERKKFKLVGETTSHLIAADNTDWTEVETFFELDPLEHEVARTNCLNDTRNVSTKCYSKIGDEFLSSPWTGDYDGLKIRIETSSKYAGGIGVDDVKIEKIDSAGNIIEQIALTNGGFSQGHEQVSAGDHAANFLSRLNGTAFWGSLSHHQSDGHSFDKHPQETLIYFMRGLPLGDAVWFAENYNSGILYGDPLYSPIAVHLLHTEIFDGRLSGIVEITGDTINGTSDNVITNYQVDYCMGEDFFTCDINGTWVNAVGDGGYLYGKGGLKNQMLGGWDVSNLVSSKYVVRLGVSSSNQLVGQEQTFYDYKKVIVGDAQKPVIAYFETEEGYTYGVVGDTIYIYGENFIPNYTSVNFGDINAAIISESETLLVVQVPEITRSTVITVTNTIDSTNSNKIFTILPTEPPIINSIGASDGRTSGSVGSAVGINGVNFMPGVTQVYFSGGVEAAFSNGSGTEELLLVLVPEGAITGPITVSTVLGSALSSQEFTVIPPAPVITSIASPTGSTSGSVGSAVGINGKNFILGETHVYFSGGVEAAFSNDSSGAENFLLVMVPEGAQSGPIIVTTPGGYTISSQTFTIIPPAPIISNIALSNGSTSGSVGSVVGINGVNFIPGETHVYFSGGVEAVFSNGSSGAENFLLVIVPENAQTGPIIVTTPGGYAISSQTFTIIPPAPVISNIALSNGSTSGTVGNALGINGQNFIPGETHVYFSGGVEAAFSNGSSGAENFLLVIVPEGAQTGTITVTTPSGYDISSQTFTILP